jgi:hypothetical protein
MSAWHSLSGSVRVRRCHEVEAIIAVIRSHRGRHFAFDVDVIPVDSETDEFSIDGTAEFAAEGELKLDTLIDSLGPHALVGAVLTGNYDNEPCELAVAPTAEAGAIAVSRHRLIQIKPLMSDLTTEDRESFAALLQEANG